MTSEESEPTEIYGTSPLKRPKRQRRTNAQLDDVDTAIIEAVAEDSPVSLRGVFYRCVSAGAVEKSEKGYALVQRQLLKLRRTGLVDYGDIVDGTRITFRQSAWSRLDEMLDSASASYRRMIWDTQDSEVLMFSEKDAISGVVMPVCMRWHVPLGIVRGYSSETFAHSVAEEVADAMDRDKSVFLYQLGDHDPSGVDAWRSFEEKIRGFLGMERHYDHAWQVEFQRLAVTPDQISELGLPTRPTKQTDTRAAKFRGESVEVDAIRAGKLRDIVESAIVQHIDQDALAEMKLVEAKERETLGALIDLAAA
jgi:hypothetical protein